MRKGARKMVLNMILEYICKSLYIVVSRYDGLRALRFFSDKLPNQERQEPFWLDWLNLVLGINQQICGVAIGTKMGPNYFDYLLVLWKTRF